MLLATASHEHDAGELTVDRGFFGHPAGLGYLSLAYNFERFAFYGMQSLLALYMADQLLRPGHAERVWGLAAVRTALGGAAISDAALASAIYGIYLAVCYATPLLGGIIADRLIGSTRAIVLGAVVLVAGHFLMAFEPSFICALLLLAIGVGLMKSNVATQIGALYAPDDLRRADAFQIFIGLFQISGILAPLICGTLGEKVGWHYGFTSAGISMLIALVVYLAARRHYPADPPIVRRSLDEARPKLTPAERRRMWVLVSLVPVLAVTNTINDQIYNAYILWGERSFDRIFFGYETPASWLGSLDTVIAFATSFLLIAFWRWYARNRPDPDEITKVAIGGLVMIVAGLTLVAAAMRAEATGTRISLWWAVLFELADGIGIGMTYAIGMALFVRVAPQAFAGVILGVFYLQFMLSNLIVGWIGGWLGTMPDTRFWLIHTMLPVAGTALLFLFRYLFRRELAPERGDTTAA